MMYKPLICYSVLLSCLIRVLENPYINKYDLMYFSLYSKRKKYIFLMYTLVKSICTVLVTLNIKKFLNHGL